MATHVPLVHVWVDVQAAQAPPPVPQAAFVLPCWATPAAQQPLVKQTPPHTFAFGQHAPPISVKPLLHATPQVPPLQTACALAGGSGQLMQAPPPVLQALAEAPPWQIHWSQQPAQMPAQVTSSTHARSS